jgi:hypothetical protein
VSAASSAAADDVPRRNERTGRNGLPGSSSPATATAAPDGSAITRTRGRTRLKQV